MATKMTTAETMRFVDKINMKAKAPCDAAPGFLVLDPFAGSGTTGIAAISLGMKFIGFETTQSS